MTELLAEAKCLKPLQFLWGTVQKTCATSFTFRLVSEEQAESQIDDIFSSIDVDGSGECSMEVMLVTSP
jgi:hypothetical protein